MLYDRWRQVVDRFKHELALTDLAARRSWTFGELAAEAEHVRQTREWIEFPQGMGSDFILTTLAAWRRETVICPLEAGQPGPPSFLDRPPAATIHLKTTSASTGAARFIAFTAEQLAADADNIVATMKLRPGWPNLGVISLAHSYGFSNLVLPLLLHGIPLILAGSALPEALRLAARAEPALTLAAVPALWRMWHDAGAIPANVKLAISAGAPLPLALEEAVFASAHLKIHNFYGSSECGGIAYDGSASPRSDAAFAGGELKNVAVSVAADGCLQVRSEAVGSGYWPDPDPDLAQGRFKTSDLGEVSRGCVFLRGRATDLINVAGRKASPEAIESLISAHPGVHTCLVFGVPAAVAGRGEKIVACVSLANDAKLGDLKHFVASRMPGWQVPREWWLVDNLGCNERGKLSRAEWRARYLESGPRNRPGK